MNSEIFGHIVITGASSGLGAALAQLYAARNRTLTLIGRNDERLASVASVCMASGASVRTILSDVAEVALPNKLLRVDFEKPVDLLIANAGLGGSAVLAQSCGESRALATEIITTNVLGTLNTVTPLLERMCAREQGHIVLVSSIAALHGLAEAPVYAASKAAIRVYGHGLRRLLAGRGVNVTVVTPGFIDTPMSQSLKMPRPFLWDTERAARRIVTGIARNRSEIIFPWQLQLTSRLLDFFPTSVRDVSLDMASRLFGGRT